jgi:two-component system response regulator ChvI
LVAEFEALLLRNLGYTVRVAADGVEAERSIAASDDIDLILTDLKMPRMDGRELLKRVGRTHPRMKMILTSGTDMTESVIPDRMGVDILPKPFNIHTLAEKVRTALDN